ncbi:MAG: AAA family ATPase [Pirellulales bacterium]
MTTAGNDDSLSLFADHFLPGAFYCGTPQREAVARMEHLIDRRHRLGLIAGPAGSGKSWILESLHVEFVRRGAAVAHVSAIGSDPREFLWQLNAQLGTRPPYDDSPFRLWRRLTDRLSENRTIEQSTILLLDDIDRGQGNLQTLIVRIVAHDACRGAGPAVIVSATRDGRDRLASNLTRLVELHICLEPWTRHEIGDYVEKNLAQAVGPPVAMEAAAVTRLHQLSRGVPRRARRLAALAWTSVCDLAEDTDALPVSITAADVEAALEQIGTPCRAGAEGVKQGTEGEEQRTGAAPRPVEAST